jgi:hypothetical protein
MKIRGHTSIEQLQVVPEQIRVQLKALWVESVEEYLGLLAAADESLVQNRLASSGGSLQQVRESVSTILSPSRFQTLTLPKPGGHLGCLLDPERLQRLDAEGRIGPVRVRPPTGFEGKLPKAVRLMEKLHPVKNQGERGTCVSFASVALREFLENKKPVFSEQFLYWACKELDGIPGPGTYVHTAMTAFNRYGVCLERTWPYNPHQDDNDESQGPPPDKAIREAEHYRMLESRTVEPTLVEDYKRILAGDDDAPGMPIVFGVPVFNSWYQSPETHRTGKITLPLPGEHPMGGHAMCVVGYVDDDDVPGGGYFIVRNSWGDGWAEDSPEAAGHALMPYEYVERYGMEAFTGPGNRVRTQVSQPDDNVEAYICPLPKRAVDLEGRTWDAGTLILANPLAPDEFMVDTPANRQKFTTMDFTWTAKTRAKVYFPLHADLGGDLAERLSLAHAVRQRFMAALDDNLEHSVGQPIPSLNQPFHFRLLPWQPKIRQVEEYDLWPYLKSAMKKLAGVPAEVSWPSEWEKSLDDTNEVRVYVLRGLTAEVHAVVAFLAPLRFGPREVPQLCPVAPALMDMIDEAYQNWRTTRNVTKPIFQFISIGTSSELAEGLRGLAGGDFWRAFSKATDDTHWQTSIPERFTDLVAVHNFLDRLKPETREQRILKVRSVVDELLDTGYEGSIHVEKIRSATEDVTGFPYRRSSVVDALFALQKRSEDRYFVYRHTDGQIAITTPKRARGKRVNPTILQPNWVRRHFVTISGFVGGAIANLTASVIVRQEFPNRKTILQTVLISIIAGYLTSLCQKQINKDKAEKE